MGIKYKVNENFFSKWSSEMAYVLGYIYADGSLEDAYYIRGKYLRITSIDLDSIQRIKKWLNSEHVLKARKSSFAGSHICYVLRIGSHKIYNDLITFGLHPHKSLTINFPKIPKKYVGHFIRGYFDGDGCIYFERGRGKNDQLIIKRIRTIFTSGSRSFLDGMDAIIKNFGISSGKIYKNHRAFRAVYNNTDSIKIFKLMYEKAGINSFFMRKFSIFREYFELRPIHIDRCIKTILKSFNNGHVVK